ncbi:Transmembrane protein [Pseudomonas cichorii]|nr:Transmembrane protein [Pseudomonas cichorii]
MNLRQSAVLETFIRHLTEKTMARQTAQNAQEILMADFQTLVADTEKLLEHTATLAGDQADELRSQIHESLLRARETLKLTEESLRERGQAAVIATEDYVQNNPWQSVGIAAGVGFILGLLATRR